MMSTYSPDHRNSSVAQVDEEKGLAPRRQPFRMPLLSHRDLRLLRIYTEGGGSSLKLARQQAIYEAPWLDASHIKRGPSPLKVDVFTTILSAKPARSLSSQDASNSNTQP